MDLEKEQIVEDAKNILIGRPMSVEYFSIHDKTPADDSLTKLLKKEYLPRFVPCVDNLIIIGDSYYRVAKIGYNYDTAAVYAYLLDNDVYLKLKKEGKL